MTVKDFISLIEEKFPYLFAESGFRTKLSKEIRPDHNLIGLESKSFRILFEQERDGFGVFVGTLDESFENLGDGWVNLYSLMTYLTKRKIDWSILDNTPYSEQTDVMFSTTAKEFYPLTEQIAKMLASSHSVNQWKPLYDKQLKAVSNTT